MQINRQIDIQADKSDRQAGRRTEGQMEGPTNKQTDKHISSRKTGR
jgi:hypothetical protein